MSKDGYILTNAHVVSNSRRIRIALYDRHEYDADLVGLDIDSDLAVVKIDAPNLIPAEWGDSEAADVGSIVWAIGSPYGLDQTVTSGIISGKNRRDEDHQNRELLQTDAAVNPGNSGGPLVDANGYVIGINTSIFGETFQGISFAVPSTIAKFVFQQLISYGKVTRGYLGVEPWTVFQDVADHLKLPNLDGAYVRRVAPDSPAAQGGLRMHDVILSWNDEPITVHSQLFRLVEMTPPNDQAKVVVARDGDFCELEITVGDREEALRRR
jgi:serine protease Do